jgi:hypothetical protein
MASRKKDIKILKKIECDPVGYGRLNPLIGDDNTSSYTKVICKESGSSPVKTGTVVKKCTVTGLDLSWCYGGKASARAYDNMKHVARLKNLETVNLGGNDMIISEIIPLFRMKKLAIIDFSPDNDKISVEDRQRVNDFFSATLDKSLKKGKTG